VLGGVCRQVGGGGFEEAHGGTAGVFEGAEVPPADEEEVVALVFGDPAAGIIDEGEVGGPLAQGVGAVEARAIRVGSAATGPVAEGHGDGVEEGLPARRGRLPVSWDEDDGPEIRCGHQGHAIDGEVVAEEPHDAAVVIAVDGAHVEVMDTGVGENGNAGVDGGDDIGDEFLHVGPAGMGEAGDGTEAPSGVSLDGVALFGELTDGGGGAPAAVSRFLG